jgi:membrane protein
VGSVTLLIERLPFWRNQDSINIIWNLKAKPKRGWLKWVKDRLLSSSLIAGLSFLLIVSFMVNGVLLALNDWLKHYFPNVILLF